ncbi:MAG TPA: methylmalonyl-CoA mutase family protein, partial [Pseudolabrys sp.]|nr:methylmalonyl-CoA mutase family protein [Pseudolabrys sp.]
YHMQEAGATLDLELAYTLADGVEYVRAGVKAGLGVDQFVPRISFFWNAGMNYFMEIAKQRAARMLWAKLIKAFNPKNDKSLALPTDFSARIARNTQIVLQQEAGATRIVDPWGGSYYVERLTYELARKAWGHIEEVEALGGMAKAIEAGIPKLRIEEAAAKTQARIDSGHQSVIGVNKFPPAAEAPIDVLKVDNSAVMQMQLDKLARLKAERDPAALKEALDALTRAADRGNGNLLALAVDAARAKATVGEISSALEKVYGRHVASIKAITGVYKREVGKGDKMTGAVERVRALVEGFETAEGRRPRLLVAKIGQDGHDRGQKVIASAFADLGFDVDIGPLFATPAEAARQAVENDVHILGVSSLAAAHLTLVPELKKELAAQGRDDIMIVVGGVVPPQDYDALMQAGCEAIFPPGTVIAEAAEKLLKTLTKRSAD